MDKGLLKTIQVKFKIDEKKAKLLISGLEAALGYHEEMGFMYHNEITTKEYKEEMQSAYVAIKKLNKTLKNIGANKRQILDLVYYATSNADEMLQIGTAAQSGLQIVTLRIEETIKYEMNNLMRPGRGRGRREGGQYIAGIEMLADWFLQAFPNGKISSNPNSKFFKYVEIWFLWSLKQELPDIARHIEYTKKHPIASRRFIKE